MGAAKHTPGPWVDERSRSKSQPWRIVAEGRGIVANGIVGGGTADNGEANARLIAAAPDLLAALERVLPYVERYGQDLADNSVDTPETGGGAQVSVDKVHDAWQFASAAIAKARGGR